jgi:hypothetical protein
LFSFVKKNRANLHKLNKIMENAHARKKIKQEIPIKTIETLNSE